MIVGNAVKGSVYSAVSGRVYLIADTLAAPARIPKVTVAMDGFGGSGGVALVRPVIFADGGARIALGDEREVPAGTAPGWLDLPFWATIPGGPALAAGKYRVGVLVGGDSGVLRLYADSVPPNLVTNPSFEDALAPWGQIAGSTGTLARSSAWAQVGAWSALAAGAGPDSGIRWSGPSVQSGVSYRLLGTVRVNAVPAGGSVKLRMLNTVPAEAAAVSTPAGALGEHSLDVEFTASQSAAWPVEAVATGPAGTYDFALDGVMVALLDAPGQAVAYHDGTEPDRMWLGAAHSSASSAGASGVAAYATPPSTLPALDTFGYLSAYMTLTPEDPEALLADDFTIASRGFATAQAQLSAGVAPDASTLQRVSCGWHGTFIDEAETAFAVCKIDGELAPLVGERLRVRYRRHEVTVYLLDEADIAEELSLTRRAFMGLANPAAEELTVTVEVLA